MTAAPAAAAQLEVAHASHAREGESANGDAVVVRSDGVTTLLAVIDALGHGRAAAEVAATASEWLGAQALDAAVGDVMAGLHARLRGSRGAAAMVCLVRGRSLSGCGVGNVELRVEDGALPVILSAGVLGGSLRKLRVFEGALKPHARLAIYSDGVSARFSLPALRALSPEQACRAILREHRRAHDDATVLIADVES